MAQKIDLAQYAKEGALPKKKVPHLQQPSQYDNVEHPEETPDQVNLPSQVGLVQRVIWKHLVDSNTVFKVQKQNRNSHVSFVRKFEALNLNPKLLKGVHDMGFTEPSKIQKIILPTILANPPQNVIVEAVFYTKETIALAMLSRVDITKTYPQVLCLLPTYEQVLHMGEIVVYMAQFCPEIKVKYAIESAFYFRSSRAYKVPKETSVSRGVQLTEHIIIGTPKEVSDWAFKFRVFDLKKLTVFILDRADMILAIQDHNLCVGIHKNLNPNCQMLFSSSYDQDLMTCARKIVRDPVIIKQKMKDKSLSDIQQYYLKCLNPQSKYNVVKYICRTIGLRQAIIICQTKRTIKWLAEKISAEGYSVAVLTGDLTLEEAIKVRERFRQVRAKLLITTNILSKGIDVEQLTIVVYFDLPVDMTGKADFNAYLHSITSMQKFDVSGVIINLVNCQENMNICRAIEKRYKIKMKCLNVEGLDKVFA